MSPSELEEYIHQDPMPTLRLTLASGDQIVIRDEDRTFISGLVLTVPGSASGRFVGGPRLISIPNIVLVEPL
jgi:hypothetical protein